MPRLYYYIKNLGIALPRLEVFVVLAKQRSPDVPYHGEAPLTVPSTPFCKPGGDSLNPKQRRHLGGEVQCLDYITILRI